MLAKEFEVLFCELHTNAKDIHLFQNPFAVDLYEASPSVQFELAELQKVTHWGIPFTQSVWLIFMLQFPQTLIPTLKKHGIEICTVFGSTYICTNRWVWLWPDLNLTSTSLLERCNPTVHTNMMTAMLLSVSLSSLAMQYNSLKQTDKQTKTVD